jgi:dihydroorotate dehydrogenase
MYESVIRPLLFRFDPEEIHHLSMNALRLGTTLPGLRSWLGASFRYAHPSLRREVFGLTFENPMGLAAGFDKDALLADRWRLLGFGFVEVGTVTPRPQVGNPQPRLFRLPADQAVINRMGFNNAGVEAMARRLGRHDRGQVILGANIGKNKDTPNEQAVDDYVQCFDRLFDLVDYFVVNVSSPNTPGLRSLQAREPLTHLLSTLQERNQGRPRPKPLLLKIAPDLSRAELDDVVAVAQATALSGLIATNTTISRAGLKTPAEQVSRMGNGGLSGLPLREAAEGVISYLHRQTEGQLPLVGVGGIMNAADARARLDAGASLLQSYTGFIYRGPGFVSQVLKGLVKGTK